MASLNCIATRVQPTKYALPPSLLSTIVVPNKAAAHTEISENMAVFTANLSALPLLHRWGKSSRWSSVSLQRHRGLRVKAFFFNPVEEPILREALKEPIAFMGGMFAGLLRLDLSEEPLKEWITRTVEASGITEEEINAEESKSEEEAPQQIEIE